MTHLAMESCVINREPRYEDGNDSLHVRARIHILDYGVVIHGRSYGNNNIETNI